MRSILKSSFANTPWGLLAGITKLSPIERTYVLLSTANHPLPSSTSTIALPALSWAPNFSPSEKVNKVMLTWLFWARVLLTNLSRLHHHSYRQFQAFFMLYIFNMCHLIHCSFQRFE